MASPTLGDFLARLELNIRIEPMTTQQVPRVAQLTQRTNQFNATTRRFSEIERSPPSPQWQVLTVDRQRSIWRLRLDRRYDLSLYEGVAGSVHSS